MKKLTLRLPDMVFEKVKTERSRLDKLSVNEGRTVSLNETIVQTLNTHLPKS